MRKNLMLIALATVGLASCKGGFKQANGGLLYDIHVDKSGPTIKPGDFISLGLVLKTEGDSVLGSTYDMGKPMPQIMPKDVKKGDVAEAYQFLSEGDSATVKLNIDSVFKKGQPRPPAIKGKYLIYQVKVEKVIPRGNLTDAVFQGRYEQYFKDLTAQYQKSEPVKIKKYVDANNLKTTVTASGLNYVITKAGTGANIAAGDTAVVNYTGKLLSGKVFDTSIKEVAEKMSKDNKTPLDPRRQYAPIHMAIGQGRAVKGWEEGMLLLNKGAEATLILPSSIGWGDQGAPPVIPAFAQVVFTVQVVDIIHPDPNAPKITAPQPPAVR